MIRDMPETDEAMSGSRVKMCSASAGVASTSRSLTRSLDCTEEGLAMEATQSDRHWFVPDLSLDGVYCLACGLPERNRRHAPRKAQVR